MTSKMTDSQYLAFLMANFNHNKGQNAKMYMEATSRLTKALEELEALKNPMYEEETDDYLLQIQAYWNEYIGELVYGVTMYKWDGTYREEKLSPTSKKTYKFKNWVECFHSGSAKKHLTIEEVKKMIKVVEHDS